MKDPVEIIHQAIDRTVSRTEHALGKQLDAETREVLVLEMAASLVMVLSVEAMRDE